MIKEFLHDFSLIEVYKTLFSLIGTIIIIIGMDEYFERTRGVKFIEAMKIKCRVRSTRKSYRKCSQREKIENRILRPYAKLRTHPNIIASLSFIAWVSFFSLLFNKGDWISLKNWLVVGMVGIGLTFLSLWISDVIREDYLAILDKVNSKEIAAKERKFSGDSMKYFAAKAAILWVYLTLVLVIGVRT